MDIEDKPGPTYRGMLSGLFVEIYNTSLIQRQKLRTEVHLQQLWRPSTPIELSRAIGCSCYTTSLIRRDIQLLTGMRWRYAGSMVAYGLRGGYQARDEAAVPGAFVKFDKVPGLSSASGVLVGFDKMPWGLG